MEGSSLLLGFVVGALCLCVLLFMVVVLSLIIVNEIRAFFYAIVETVDASMLVTEISESAI